MSPFSRPLLFNPIQASNDELERTFVGRDHELEALLQKVRPLFRSRRARHWLIVGPRGAGKSHLTEILSRRLASEGWPTSRLPEEHYQIARVSDLLYQTLAFLRPSQLAGPIEPSSRHSPQNLTSQLRTVRSRAGGRILLVLENLSLLLDRQLRSPSEQEALRTLLSDDSDFIMVATATRPVDQLEDASSPLFGLFHTIALDDLNRSQVVDLIEARARWDSATELLAKISTIRNRLEAVFHLSGGNPRLCLALYTVLRHGVTAELHSQFLQLLDEVTPYYQARLGDLPQQAERILIELALSTGPAVPSHIAKQTGLPTNQITSQLIKLQDERLVVPGARRDGRSRFYELKDRLLRLWIQMREDPASRSRVRFLTEFFQQWYAGKPDELTQATRSIAEAFWQDLTQGNQAGCTQRLLTLDYLRSAWPESDDVIRFDSLIEHFRYADDDTLRFELDRLNRFFLTLESPNERESVGVVIAEGHRRLNQNDEAIAVLGRLLDLGSTHHLVYHPYFGLLYYEDRIQSMYDRAKPLVARGERDASVLEALAISAAAVGHTEEALGALNDLTSSGLCDHCQLRAATRSAAQMYKGGHKQQATTILRNRMSTGERTVRQRSIEALLAIESREQDLGDDTYSQAFGCWETRDDAPGWFLSAVVCGLSHRPHMRREAIAAIDLAARNSNNDPPAAVMDHLIQLLAEMVDIPEYRPVFEAAVGILLATQRVDREFARVAPGVAASYPSLRSGVLRVYEILCERKALDHDISPYSEALSVVRAPHRASALQALHPELREAVELLISTADVRTTKTEGFRSGEDLRKG